MAFLNSPIPRGMKSAGELEPLLEASLRVAKLISFSWASVTKNKQQEHCSVIVVDMDVILARRGAAEL